jgi:predicted phage terminase large subunit-like protein
LTPAEQEAAIIAARYFWRGHARPKQLPPEGNWRVWLIRTGRGWGKTRAGAEWIRAEVESGRRGRLALVGRTAADARDVIVEGESGVLAVCPEWLRPEYEPSKRRLTWANGAIATTYSADEPDTLRGPQHDGAWADELASWRFAEAWDMLMMGLRLGENPRVVVTTTPRPIKVIRDLMAQPTTVTVTGSTFENEANLPGPFLQEIIARYQGTRLGRQELMGELLDDVPGALWTRQMMEQCHIAEAPEMVRVVVAIDPAVTSGDDADETGIVAAGKGVDGHAYVLADASCRLSPDGWGRRAVDLYRAHQADRIIAEVNNGGDLVERVIRTVDAGIPYQAVRATRGKITRAEPVAALYEQGRVFHLGGFDVLEDQLCAFASDGYMGSDSPDHADALVWAMHELMLGPSTEVGWFLA